MGNNGPAFIFIQNTMLSLDLIVSYWLMLGPDPRPLRKSISSGDGERD